MKKEKTERGFDFYKSVDRYGHGFSIQKSSLATEYAIWFGIDDPKPEIMASVAFKIGLIDEIKNGWVSYPIPENVLIHTHMHLTQEQVKELIPILQNFVETGEI